MPGGLEVSCPGSVKGLTSDLPPDVYFLILLCRPQLGSVFFGFSLEILK